MYLARLIYCKLWGHIFGLRDEPCAHVQLGLQPQLLLLQLILPLTLLLVSSYQFVTFYSYHLVTYYNHYLATYCSYQLATY